jgi:nickel-type superoxide dismutase maturation protease
MSAARGIGLVLVRGASMEPTLRDGDRLLVRWGRARLRAGAVVVVRLPGDRPLAVKRATFATDGGWWVERDNPATGVDSWQVGVIADDDVLGVVLFRLTPSPGRIHARPPGG